MNLMGKSVRGKAAEIVVPGMNDLNRVADEIYENALNDAKGQLHPLLRETEMYYLRKRNEFVDAFKLALEKSIAQKIAHRYPGVQAIFRFDESWTEARTHWDGAIHLLVQVPYLSNRIKTFGKTLDRSLTYCLKQLGWSRFHTRDSVLDVQQVTVSELRHGIGYGAMFYAVYSVPIKVWPPKR
jgi:hypothetical protein